MGGEDPLLFSGTVNAKDSLFKILVEILSHAACMPPY